MKTKSQTRVVAESIQKLNGMSLVSINFYASQYMELFQMTRLEALNHMKTEELS